MRKRKPNFIKQNTSNKNETLKEPSASSKKTQKNQITCLGWIDRGRIRHSLSLRPFNKDIDISIVLNQSDLRNHDCKMHTIVRVALSRHKQNTFNGKILEVLGPITDPEVERAIVADIHGFPTEFSAAALADADRASEHKPGKRIDLTHATIVTIDGETAKDFDDAIGVELTAEGHYLLTVSIADVSHYVREEGALNHEALERGTSVYLPQYVYPMLPEQLSNHLCSLVPNEERLTLTCELLMNKQGQILRRKIYPSTIRSKARLTYTQVAKLLDGDSKGFEPKIAEMILRAAEISRLVRTQREGRGSLDLDLPETQIVCDAQGEVTNIRYAERNEAHRLIEDLMILANEQVSSAIEERGYPSMYRIHENPDPLKIERLQQVIKHWGFRLTDSESLPEAFQKFLNEVRGHENEKTLVRSLLRSLKQAQYSASNAGHFGLGSESYCHFTSPIRRYPDLMIHRILRKSDFLKSDKPPFPVEVLETIAQSCSTAERRAFLAERDLEEFKKCRFMAGRVGQVFKALITTVKSFGVFVEVADFPVEGLIPMRFLPRDDWQPDELETRLIGYRSNQQLWLGDQVRVQLVEVNPYMRQITFRLLRDDEDGTSHPQNQRHGRREQGRGRGRDREPQRERSGKRRRR
jgi:ribonuclease R